MSRRRTGLPVNPGHAQASAIQRTTCRSIATAAGAGAPRRHILIEHAGQEVRQRGHRLARAEHVAEEARRWKTGQLDHLRECIQCRRLQTLLRHRLIEGALRLSSRRFVGSRAPSSRS